VAVFAAIMTISSILFSFFSVLSRSKMPRRLYRRYIRRMPAEDAATTHMFPTHRNCAFFFCCFCVTATQTDTPVTSWIRLDIESQEFYVRPPFVSRKLQMILCHTSGLKVPDESVEVMTVERTSSGIASHISVFSQSKNEIFFSRRVDELMTQPVHEAFKTVGQSFCFAIDVLNRFLERTFSLRQRSKHHDTNAPHK